MSSFAERFWVKVQKSDSCWVWAGYCHPQYGYGIYNQGRGKECRAHRIAWILSNGRPIPEGIWVLHKCDVVNCVRPDHLYLGTPADNTRDMMDRGRDGHGEVRGEENHNAKLTADNVKMIRLLYREGVTQVALANQFDISQAHVSAIILRKAWAHV